MFQKERLSNCYTIFLYENDCKGLKKMKHKFSHTLFEAASVYKP